MVVRGERGGVEIPAPLREQILMELMSADTLVEGIAHIMETRNSETWLANDERVIVAFADESATWRTC
jgi:hypothetical protein